MTQSLLKPPRRSTSILLWILATVLMLSAAVYQRLTGPTHPFRATVELAGQSRTVRLLRNGTTDRPVELRLQALAGAVEGSVYVRRYPTDEPFEVRPLQRQDSDLRTHLPLQPAAGKLEYFVELREGTAQQRIPAAEDDTIILRYKDPVPLWILLPHVVIMFLSMLFGTRAALAAFAGHADLRKLVWITVIGLTIGGMILGPVVQKHAFGAYWTGFPLGDDLTDNKTLLMWLAWVVAAFLVMRTWRLRVRPGRWAVVLATLIMLGVYVIPHSLRGSQLDYEQLDRGVDPREAIETDSQD